MSFSDFLYFSLNNFWTIFCYWVAALILFSVIWLVLIQFFPESHPLTYLPGGAAITGIIVFFAGFLFAVFLFFAPQMTLAPASWFARIPAKEAQFFKKSMARYKNSITVLEFISIQEDYTSKYNSYNSLMSQKRALK